MCQREGVVDFAELLLRSYELLAGHDALREHYRRRFSHLLVDEFQDTNVLQYQWLRLLAGPAHRGVRRRRRRPVDLRVPRRERRQHAALRTRLRHGRAAGHADQARAELPLARPHPRRRQRAHPQQPGAARQEPVDERGKGRAGARLRGAVRHRRGRVRRRHREGPCGARASRCPRSRCSTARTRSRGCSSTRCSMRRCPYRVYGGMRFFERAEVKHALAYLRLVAAPDDDGAFLRVVNFPPRGIGARTLEALQDAARERQTSLWQAACGGCRQGQGRREPRGLRRADRVAARGKRRAPAAGGRRPRERALGPHCALSRGEGRAGPARQPRGARQRRRRVPARSGPRRRCADRGRGRQRCGGAEARSTR